MKMKEAEFNKLAFKRNDAATGKDWEEGEMMGKVKS